MNTSSVVLIIFLVLSVLYCLLNIAEKIYKCVENGECDCFKEKQKDEEPLNAVNSSGNAKTEELELPTKVLSFKRAMLDISNSV